MSQQGVPERGGARFGLRVVTRTSVGRQGLVAVRGRGQWPGIFVARPRKADGRSRPVAGTGGAGQGESGHLGLDGTHRGGLSFWSCPIRVRGALSDVGGL